MTDAESNERSIVLLPYHLRLLNQHGDQVLVLRQQGLTREEIADRLNLTRTCVKVICHFLVAFGRLKPLVPQKPPTGPRPKTGEHDSEILRLRVEEKLTYAEIAERLSMSLATVSGRIRALKKAGRIILRQYFRGQKRLRRRRSAKLGDTAWHDLDHPLTKRVIELKRNDAMLKQIGQALGVTHERARQILEKIITYHGKEIFGPDRRSLEGVARQLGVSAARLLPLLPILGIEKHSHRRVYRLLPEHVAQLGDALAVKRRCRMCGAALKPKQVALCAKRKCHRQSDQARNRTLYEKPIEEVKFNRWHRAVIDALHRHQEPAGETWLTSAPAQKVSGLTQMQLMYLGRRGIVRVRPHPTKRWSVDSTRPVDTYAASEMELIRQVRLTLNL